MATLIVMPKQGNTVDSCILTKWFKREGDTVKPGERLFAYETDKSAFEEAAQAGGTLLKILCGEGDEVPVTEAVCVLGGQGEDISSFIEAAPRHAAPTAGDAGIPQAEREADGYVDAPLSNIRRRIAESMRSSLAEAAQATHHSSADAASLMDYRAKVKDAAASGGANVTLNDMALFAVSRALLNHPDMNAHFLGDRVRRFDTVNLGVAVDTERGLMVPTIFHAEGLTLEEIAKKSRELAEKCRAGAIGPDMLSGGTFTVTNLGALGMEMITPVLNPPQTGILGVCGVLDRIRRKGNGFELYPAMGISLTYDHRAIDGAPASRFLREVCRALTEFETFLAKHRGI